jgi:hypothetical protein
MEMYIEVFMKRTDVLLTGGGLKGAYQYGFFNRLYNRHPTVPIDRVFGASVGAINAPAVLLGRMDLLDEYWQNTSGAHPFDTIMNSWDSRHHHSKYTPQNNDNNYHKGSNDNNYHRYGIISNIHQIVNEGSIFRSLRREPFEELWRCGLSDDERTLLASKLNIISYDRCFGDTVVFRGYHSAEDFSAAVLASTNHPCLVRIDNTFIDGIFADYDTVLAYIRHTSHNNGAESSNLLILDLQSYGDTGSFQLTGLYNTHVYTFKPDWNRLRRMNHFLSLCASRSEIDYMVSMGGEDADAFMDIQGHE